MKPVPARRPGPRWRSWPLGFAGAALALGLAGEVQADIGPFATTVSARPALTSETTVRLAPLGSLTLDTHRGPVALELSLDELRVDEAERIAADPTILRTLEEEVVTDVRRAVRALLVRCLLVALAGGVIGGLVASEGRRGLLQGTVAGAVLTALVGGAVILTFDQRALGEPRYSGLLQVAPAAVGDVEAVVERFDEYGAQLGDLVANVVTIYRAVEGLPTFRPPDDSIRVLHVSDIHLNPQAFDLIDLLVDQYDVDVVADTGDTTDWGTEPEARLVARIGRVPVPYVWVRGNHDSTSTEAAVARQANAHVLDGDPVTVAGLRFWGIADRRYTPRKDQPTGGEVEREEAELRAPVLERLLLADRPERVDVLMVHDERMAADVGDDVPLVLSGHTHEPRAGKIGEAVLLVEGSTGGAGLRGLQKAEPEPLACSILYFDRRTRRLTAYDRIEVSGLGGTAARIERHVVTPDRPRQPDEPGG